MLFVQDYRYIFFSWIVPLSFNVRIAGLQLVCSLQVCLLQLPHFARACFDATNAYISRTPVASLMKFGM